MVNKRKHWLYFIRVVLADGTDYTVSHTNFSKANRIGQKLYRWWYGCQKVEIYVDKTFPFGRKVLVIKKINK